MEKTLVPMGDIEKMGTAIAQSGLFGMKTPAQAIALMLVSQAQGRHPATVAMEYDIIQGRPALKSQAGLMRFQEAGGKVEYIKRTDAEVIAKFSHPAGGTLEVSWTMDRAKKMGLSDKDNWKKQPMIMLQWRVIAEGVRACFPACLGGSYLVEEVQDFDPPKGARDVTPQSEVVPPIEGEIVPEVPKAPVITDGQRKRFFAIAKKAGAKDEDVKAWLLENYGFDSSSKITGDIYEDVCEKVLTLGKREPGAEG